MITAFRAVRLSEVTGLPPVNFPDSDFPLGAGAATGILKLGAEELITVGWTPQLGQRRGQVKRDSRWKV